MKNNDNPKGNKMSNGCFVLFIIALFMFFYFLLTATPDKEPPAGMNDTMGGCIRASRYLKTKYLNDPDSFQEIGSSELSTLKDKTGYMMKYRFRAKNALGGYVTQELLVIYDNKMNVVHVEKIINK